MADINEEEFQHNQENPPKQDITTGQSSPSGSISDSDQRDIVHFVQKKFDHFQNLRKDKETDWIQYYDNYRQILPEGHKWRSRVSDPATFQQIESITPRVVEALIPQGDFFEVRSSDPTGFDQEESVKELIKHQLSNAHFFERVLEAIKQAAIYGTTFIKTPFREDYETRRDKHVQFNTETNPITGESNRTQVSVFETEPTRVRTFFGPDIEVVDIFDLYTDPLDTDLTELVHVSNRSLEYLREKQREGVYVNVEDLVADGPDHRMDSSGRGAERWANTGLKPEFTDREQIIVKEYWGNYDLDGDGIKEPVVLTIANESVLLAAEANPYWHGKPPFISSQFVPVPKELYGVGIAESICSLQKQINEVINQRNDNISLVLNRMWVVSTLADVDLKRLSSVPGRLITTSDVNGIVPLQTPDITSSAYAEVSSLKSQVEEATGFSRFAAGLEAGKSTPRAARTVIAMQQASLQKFGTTIRLLENRLIVPLLNMFLKLDQQFLEDFEYIRVLGEQKPQIMEINPNDIRGSFEFSPLGASEMMNKEQRLQGLMTFASITQNDPTVDRNIIYKKIWKSLGMRDEFPAVQQQPLPQQPGQEKQTNQLNASGGIQPPTPPVPGLGS